MIDFSATQLAALDLDRSFVVRAGAGSGKTTLLVERIAHQLEREVATSDDRRGAILALTFTDKAAIEMRGRLRDRLIALAHEAPERWALPLAALPRVELSTIHAFAGRLVRRHAGRLGIDPGFEIADQGALRHRFGELTDEVLLRAEWQEPALVKPLAQVLDRSAVVGTLRALFEKRPDSAEWARSVAGCGTFEAFRVHARDERDALFRGLAAGFAGDREAIELRAQLMRVLPDSPLLVGPKLVDTLAAIDGGLASVAGVSALRALADDLHVKLNRSKSGWRTFPASKDLGPYIDRFKDHLKLIRPADDLDRLDRLAELAIYHLGVLFLRALEEYQRIQEREGFLDFSDLVTRALGLLESDAAVAREERVRYGHILVDELQDTDGEQWRLVRALVGASEPGASAGAREGRMAGAAPKATGRAIEIAGHGEARVGSASSLFLVGDEKQSIFGFRGADVSVVAQAAAYVTGAGGVELVLAENYRSRARLLAVIDATFTRVFAPSNLSAHAPYEARPQPLLPRAGDGGVVRILASRVVPPPEHKHDPSAARMLEHPDALEARSIAREVLSQRQRGRAFEDVAILFRTRSRLQGIVSALEAAGVPHVTWRGSGFFDRPEVADAIAMARVLLDRRDPVALLAALRSPTLAMSDAGILSLHSAGEGSIEAGLVCAAGEEAARRSGPALGRNQVLHSLDARDRAAALRAHALIERGRAMVVASTLAATLRELFEGAGTYATLAAAPDGDQRIANLEKLLDLFRRQQDRGVGPRAALEIVEGQAGGESPEGMAPVDLEGRAGVRLMTVHSAKGLEFPVVIVPGIDDKVATAKSDRLLLEDLPGIGPRLGLSISDDMLAEHGIRAYSGPRGRSKGKAMSSTRQAVVDRTSRREKAEAKRVLYVACTRAKEELVLVATLEQGKRGNYIPTYFHPLTWWALLSPAWGIEAGIEPSCGHIELDGERIEVAWGDPGEAIDPRRDPPALVASALEALERDDAVSARRAEPTPGISPLAIEAADVEAFLACPLRLYHRQTLGEVPMAWDAPAEPMLGPETRGLETRGAEPVVPNPAGPDQAAPNLARWMGDRTETWGDVPLAVALDHGAPGGGAVVSARADQVWRDAAGRWCLADGSLGSATRLSTFLAAWILDREGRVESDTDSSFHDIAPLADVASGSTDGPTGLSCPSGVGVVVARDQRGHWLAVEGDALRARLEALDSTLARMVGTDYAPPPDPPCAGCVYASIDVCDRAET